MWISLLLSPYIPPSPSSALPPPHFVSLSRFSMSATHTFFNALSPKVKLGEWVGSWGVGLSHPVWTRPAQPCGTCLAHLVKSLDWKGLLSYFLVQHWYLGLPRWLSGKESACQAGDSDLAPGSGRSPGEGNDKPLQYSCLGKSMDRGAWWATVPGVTKSLTWLSDSTATAAARYTAFLLSQSVIFPYSITTLFITYEYQPSLVFPASLQWSYANYLKYFQNKMRQVKETRIHVEILLLSHTPILFKELIVLQS